MTPSRFIVLDEGQVMGKGTHEELMESCEVYRGIALSQLSKEELAAPMSTQHTRATRRS